MTKYDNKQLQLSFARETTRGWREKTNEFLTRDELAKDSVWDWIPEKNFEIKYGYSTSGTTGQHLETLWSKRDIERKFSLTSHYMLKTFAFPRNVLALSFFSLDQYAGALHSGWMDKLNGVCLPYGRFLADPSEAWNAIKAAKCDAVVIPAGSDKTRLTIEQLLSSAPSEHSVKMWIGSGSTLTTELVAQMNAAGITAQFGFYGCSESGHVGISCQRYPRHFHLFPSDIVTEVVNQEGRHVLCGERGLVRVSRVGIFQDGKFVAHGGTQVINYMCGDTAVYLDDDCGCGQQSPRICDIERLH